jgi:tRNA pseudouridine38-40 synthase
VAPRTLQLVLHYDGGGFAGWQRQPGQRTVQGVLEDALARLCGAPVPVTGAGRTDAGVHARGQAAGVVVPDRWTPDAMARALNAILPDDLWVAAAHAMRDGFHARFDATARRYSYRIGTDGASRSPFRNRWEISAPRGVSAAALDEAAAQVVGTHRFVAFAVKGTAPATDDHRCTVVEACWVRRPDALAFEIEANRFLHHMVRFLVGTMLEIATGRRPAGDLSRLLTAPDNAEVSPPAPPQALCLDAVRYPPSLYLAIA